MAVKRNDARAAPRKRARSRPVEKPVPCETTVKKMQTKNRRKALIIAQEIKFARLLASNDKSIRDKVLRSLKKWLTVRSQSSFAFAEADFMRLWKGLFYCMWMADKPLVQEELAESVSDILHCFQDARAALLYMECTLKTLAREWFGIDRYRLDKFEMLVRRILRQMFETCRRRSWDEEWTKGVAFTIQTILSDPKTGLGFFLHITELYMEEMAKIGAETVSPDRVADLIRPFALHLAETNDVGRCRHIVQHIFRYLIIQSDVGMDYAEKFQAWHRAGFPCKNIDDMQRVDESDEELTDEDEDANSCIHESTQMTKVLDPRAGKVDVELPQLSFDPSTIVEMMREYKFHPKTTVKTRRYISRLIVEFSELARGNMPIGVKEIVAPRQKNPKMSSKKAAHRLLEFQKDIYSDKIRGKRKKRRALTANDENENATDNDEDDDDDDDIGFENTLIPINQHELERNENEEEEKEFFKKSRGSEMNEISYEKGLGNKNASKKNVIQRSSDATIEASKCKRKKRRKENCNEESTSVDAVDAKIRREKRFATDKSIGVGVKKNKANGLRSTVGRSKKKLLNCSYDDALDDKGASTKGKKLQSSRNETWDVSNNDDPPTPTLSPASGNLKMVSVTENVAATVSKTSEAEHSIDKKIPWLLPVLTKLEDEKSKLHTPEKTQLGTRTDGGSSAKKRVKIMLRRNTAQHTSEYFQQLRLSPAIPYDANRKPLAGVLKPSPLSSPINPFYKKA